MELTLHDPESNTGDAGSDPITTGYTAPNYWAPDWVFVNNQGATLLMRGHISHRAIRLHGLRRRRIGGYELPLDILRPPTIYNMRKGSLAFTDLSGLPAYPRLQGQPPRWTTLLVVALRSAQPSGNFSPPPSFSFSAKCSDTYYNFVLFRPN